MNFNVEWSNQYSKPDAEQAHSVLGTVLQIFIGNNAKIWFKMLHSHRFCDTIQYILL